MSFQRSAYSLTFSVGIDLSGSEVQAGDFVWEMQSKEFVYHIGMLVMEGRTPQLSDKGRVEGPHCLPLSGHISHVCDFSKNKDVSVGCLNFSLYVSRIH